jgi:hypothetical protein
MEMFILISLLIFLIFVCIFGTFMVFMFIRTGVPFIPTKDEIVEGMMSAINFKNNQTIYELGCGNGKMMFKIKKECDKKNLKNIKIKGYELISPLVWWVKWKKRTIKNTTNKIEIFSRDFFKQDLADADIIFCYLFPPIMQRIFREIWPKLKEGTVLISHAFRIDDLKPKEVFKVDGTRVYVYEK